MAKLPSEQYLIQQIGGTVILFECYTERELARFDPADGRQVAEALDTIRASELGDEDACFALVWAGYFHAYADRAPEMVRETFVTEADDGTVFVMNGTAIVVSFDPADMNAVALAQKRIYDSGLSQRDKDRAHFWSGFHYGLACQ